MHIRKMTLGRGVMGGVLLNIALIGYGVLRFPAVLREGGVSSTVLTFVLLVVYGLAGWQARRQTEEASQTALAQGAKVGLVLGGVMVVHLTMENFLDLNVTWSTITSLALFPILFFSFGFAGWSGSRHTGKLGLGVVAAVWSALVCILMTCSAGYLADYLFMPRMEQILHNSPEYLRSGMHELQAFTVFNCLDAASSHLVIAPVLAIIFGSIGGLLGENSARHRTTRPVQT